MACLSSKNLLKLCVAHHYRLRLQLDYIVALTRFCKFYRREKRRFQRFTFLQKVLIFILLCAEETAEQANIRYIYFN